MKKAQEQTMLPEQSSYLMGLVEIAAGSQYRPGNTVEVLQNGDQIFPAILAAIRGAESSIELVTYVFWRSNIATEIADALCERARAGVSVRLLVDAVGGASMSTRTVWQLERAGAKVAWFRPGRWAFLRKLNNRTHRKVLIVDGKIGFTGGVGIADEWTGRAQDRKHWRETHCRITGPACTDLFYGFAENWREATGEKLEPPKPADAQGAISIHTTVSTAGTHPTAMEQLFSTAIRAARRRLWITTAYFVPSEDYVEALIAAAERHVDVRVLTNGSLSNHKITRRAGHACYQRLLEAGVKIYEYQGTVLHSKIMTVDGAWATLGSTNLDDRSLILNDELNISFADPDLVGNLDLEFLEDLKRAKHIRRTHWYQRGPADRLAEAGSRVFRRQL